MDYSLNIVVFLYYRRCFAVKIFWFCFYFSDDIDDDEAQQAEQVQVLNSKKIHFLIRSTLSYRRRRLNAPPKLQLSSAKRPPHAAAFDSQTLEARSISKRDALESDKLPTRAGKDPAPTRLSQGLP